MIAKVLETLGKKVWLVGNIDKPALDVLDSISPEDIVVYEMSSFQLWDLEKSPHIAVVLRIEPDHLNVHDNFEDYVNAKSNITKHQTPADFCIFFKNNEESVAIAEKSKGHKLLYPIENPNDSLKTIINSLNVPGSHNKENAEAALLAAATAFNLPLGDFITKHEEELVKALSSFEGLPHRCQFIRELNGVKYYDDNFSTTLPSLEVALQAFPNENKILILGGRDKSNGENNPLIINLLKHTNNLKSVVLMGESGHVIFDKFNDGSLKFLLAESLQEAVETAKKEAEKIDNSIVLMSPAAASFDMFENVYDRGAKYQKVVKGLK
jgi:UDP-N-acetylmuramoylalanine--D-glutamate ligase